MTSKSFPLNSAKKRLNELRIICKLVSKQFPGFNSALKSLLKELEIPILAHNWQLAHSILETKEEYLVQQIAQSDKIPHHLKEHRKEYVKLYFGVLNWIIDDIEYKCKA